MEEPRSGVSAKKRGVLNENEEEWNATIGDPNYNSDSTLDISDLLPKATLVDTATADGGPPNRDGAFLTKKRTKESSRVSFPMKLHQILSNPEYVHIIRWMPHGRSWNIYDKDLLASVVCKEHFNHDKFDSFNRSVNGWGFKRLFRAGPDCKSYYHELFLRGRPELAKLMKRLVNPGRRLPDPQREPDFYDITKYPLPPDQTANEEEGRSEHVKGQDLPSHLIQEDTGSTKVQGRVQVPPVNKGPRPVQISYPPSAQSIHPHHPSYCSNPVRRVARDNVPYLNSLQMPQPLVLQSPVAFDYHPYYGQQHPIYQERVALPSHNKSPHSHQYDLQYPHHAHQASQCHHYPPRQHVRAAGYGEMVYYQWGPYHQRPHNQITPAFDDTFENSLHFSSNNFASHCAVASVASSYEETIEYQHQFNHYDELESFEAKGDTSFENAKQSVGEFYGHEIDELMPTADSYINTSRNHDEAGLALPTSSIGKPPARNRSLSTDVWSVFFEDKSQDTANALLRGQHSMKNRKLNDHEKEHPKEGDYADSNDRIDHY